MFLADLNGLKSAICTILSVRAPVVLARCNGKKRAPRILIRTLHFIWFDIHAMIRTTDAPSLEKALHNHFDQKRVNLENNRKEFFYVSIQEIKEQLDILKTELGIESEFQLTMLAEAKQYRQSESKRIHLQKMYENS